MDKYFNFGRELKKLWNTEVTVIPIVVGALGTVLKSQQKSLGELEVREKSGICIQ